MANFFLLTLDTIAPINTKLLLDGGSTYLTNPSRLCSTTITTDDVDTTGYQMKIWGDVDASFDANIGATENDSAWFSYVESKQIKVSDVDGKKDIYVKIRDDVHNESDLVTSSITLNTSIPTVEITGVDVDKISKNSGKDVVSFSFTASDVFATEFVEYKVCVVSSDSSAHDAGVVIAQANGSTNMSGTGNFPMDTPINCTIKGADLEVASSGDGAKTIKVFVRQDAGIWSV